MSFITKPRTLSLVVKDQGEQLPVYGAELPGHFQVVMMVEKTIIDLRGPDPASNDLSLTIVDRNGVKPRRVAELYLPDYRTEVAGSGPRK